MVKSALSTRSNSVESDRSHSRASQSPPDSSSRTRRWSSESEEEEDEEDEPKPKGKRARKVKPLPGPNRKASVIELDGIPADGLTEKEARKEARMIRNRNAAQASRDRKKENATVLEQRVAELEAQLRSTGRRPNATSLPRELHTSIAPLPASRILALQGENESLRARLSLEQTETNRLRARLGHLEDKFSQLEQFFSPSQNSTPFVLSSPPTKAPEPEPTFTLSSTHDDDKDESLGDADETFSRLTSKKETNGLSLVAAETIPLFEESLVSPLEASMASCPLSPLSTSSSLSAFDDYLNVDVVSEIWDDWSSSLVKQEPDLVAADSMDILCDFSLLSEDIPSSSYRSWTSTSTEAKSSTAPLLQPIFHFSEPTVHLSAPCLS